MMISSGISRTGTGSAHGRFRAGACAVLLGAGSAGGGWAGAAPEASLELREVRDGKVAPAGVPIPRGAARVFTFASAPAGVRVTEKHIAAAYDRCGILFDRATGAIIARFTVVDGWPDKRPPEFPPARGRRSVEERLVGPGIVCEWRSADAPLPPDETAASAEFEGATWRAVQPTLPLESIMKGVGWSDRRKQFGSWSSILRALHDRCHVERAGRDAGPVIRFTVADGLASNIVTHLVPAQGTLWAACVDIYDPDKKAWGPGGLCRYRDGAWRRVEQIGGRPVRWVTLLQALDDEVWVGFRQGSDVAGNEVVYGMGLYPGIYRPKATAVVLARLKDGQWTLYDRAPLADPGRARWQENAAVEPPTEKPVRLVRLGDRVFLLSRTRSYIGATGNWDVFLAARISRLDLTTKSWQPFEAEGGFGADELHDMIAESGEILVISNLGLHRWDAGLDTWARLDPQGELLNSALSAAAVVGNDLWVGYNKLSFGIFGEQGLSRYDEAAVRWEHWPPEKLGTACPVWKMASLSDGQLWIYFAARPWYGSAHEWTLYPREVKSHRPQGFGCLAGGRWSFPVAIEGANKPLSPFRTVEHLTAVRDRLFVATGDGLFAGPSPWTRVAEGEILHMSPSSDGRSLEWVRRKYGKDRNVPTFEKGRYDPADSKLELVKIDKVDEFAMAFSDNFFPYPDDRFYLNNWARVPPRKDGRWAVGPLDTRPRRVIETPVAYWIASEGEIVRVDRKIVEGLMRK
jgi:hypothetical protein